MKRLEQPLSDEGVMQLILRLPTWDNPDTWYGHVSKELIVRGLATEENAEDMANTYINNCFNRDKNFGKKVKAIAEAQERAARVIGEPVYRRMYIDEHYLEVSDNEIDRRDEGEEVEFERQGKRNLHELFGKTQVDLKETAPVAPKPALKSILKRTSPLVDLSSISPKQASPKQAMGSNFYGLTSLGSGESQENSILLDF
ncbi:hypothetical protein H072_9439 [Dactylellina haptotyla CBS 200.50]|uniref:Uncharacterized protein n=1 Tax=Dactylellina haptotyla (strain CBS 200.50) TaxID=1284197 RepID=S8A775_DACHA|nr:hypothetical protein H072_9439 [Dactylellina haptotyla CBS 200.50]